MACFDLHGRKYNYKLFNTWALFKVCLQIVGVIVVPVPLICQKSHFENCFIKQVSMKQLNIILETAWGVYLKCN